MNPQKTPAQGPQAGDGLHICLLGVPLLTEGLLSAPLAPVDALLLWRLADEGAQPGDRLARQLWPAQTGKAAANNLRQRVFRLRRRRVPLLLEGGVLQLDSCAAVDLLAPDPDQHLSPAAWARSELLDGIDVDGGELFELLAQGRERWRRQRARLARSHVQALHDSGNLAMALAWLQALLLAEPDDEAACRAVMALHLQRGDRAAAVEAFEQTERHRSRSGLGPPDARSVALLQEALRDGPAREAGSITAPTAEPPLLKSSGPNGPAAGRKAAVPGRLPVALLRPPRLIERQEALQRVTQAWRRGQLPLLLGEAGIGKSRLAQELLAVAGEDGCRVWTLRCNELGDQPYALMAQLLQQLLQALPETARDALPWQDPDAAVLAPLLPPWASRLQAQGARGALVVGAGTLLRRAVRRWLAACLSQLAGTGPLLILLDDLHRADDASLEALQGGLPGADLAATRQHTAWLATARPAELPAALSTLLDGLRSAQALEEVLLSPWSARGIAALLDDLHWPAAVDAAALQQRVGGNPFDVLEALRQAWSEDERQGEIRADPASTAAQRIMARHRRLSEPAQRLAELAALAGPCWRAHLGAGALGLPLLALTDSWRELEEAQFFATDGTVGLAHDLVRVALLQQLPAERGRELSQTLATLLAEVHDVPPAELGRLWQAAGCWRQAAQAWSAASQHAGRLGRPFEVLQHARRAIQAWARAGEPGRAFDLWFHASDAMTLTQGTEGLDQLIDELQGWADTPARRGRCAALRAFCRVNQSRLDDALALTDIALKESPPDDHELRIDLLRTQAQTLIVQGRIEAAAELLAAQQPHVDAYATALQRLQHLATQSLLYNHQRQVDRSIQALQQASDLARELGDPIEEVVHTQNLAVSLGHAGRLNEALAAAGQACNMHERLGSLLGLHGPISRVNEAQIQLQFGRFGEAIVTLEGALAAIPPAAAVWYHATRHRLALAWLWVGQLGRAGALLNDELPDSLPPASRSLHAQLRAALMRFEDGRLGPPLPTERVHLERAQAVWEGVPVAQIPLEHRLRLCRSLKPEAALVETDELARSTARQGALGLELTARVLRAELLAQQDAGRAADDVEALLPRLPMGLTVEWLPSQLLLTCVQVLELAGRSTLAEQARRRAMVWLDTAESATPPEWRAGLRARNPWHRALSDMPASSPG